MCNLSELTRCLRSDRSSRSRTPGVERRPSSVSGDSTLRHHLTPLPATDIPMKEVRMSSISSHGPSSGTDMEPRLRNNRSTTTNGSHDTPPPSPATSSDKGSKACCFCWCCCCSCSCLTVKNGDESKSQSKDGTNVDNTEKEEPPSIEDIKSWAESFDRLMGGCGRRVFREFLRSEYSEENMLFFLACEDLKKENNPELVEEKARLIYEDYISILSPKEVSLDARVREVINRNMVEPTPHTFDEAQLQIYTLMHRDSYPRFLNSQIYKRLLQ